MLEELKQQAKLRSISTTEMFLELIEQGLGILHKGNPELVGVREQ
jgi:hypothetical protein